VRTRLEEDLHKRAVRRDKMLKRMDRKGWARDWKRHGEARNLEELVWDKADLL
jgi:hypothetical protein